MPVTRTPVKPTGKIVITRRAPAGGIKSRESEPRTFGGGQFIPAELQRQEMQIAKDALTPLVDSVAQDITYKVQVYQMTVEVLEHKELAGKLTKLVPLTTTEYQIKKTIREAYDQAFILGKRAAGNLFSPTKEEKLAIQKTRLDEFTYLRNFLHDMETHGGTMSYEKRADYYAKAIRELFWLGWASANKTALRTIRWIFGDTIHCSDCLKLDQLGPMSSEVFWKRYASKGILPQSGKLECLGYHCKCRLEEAVKP